MGYKLVISEYADELLNNLIYYLIYRLKNEPAAKHLLDGIDTIGGGGKGLKKERMKIMSISLKKGDVINLSKGSVIDLIKDSSLKKVDIGLGWDTRCDLDSMAFLSDSNGVIKDTVYFGGKNKKGIFLNGDNLTGEGDGDDEIISVTFSELPSWVTKIQIEQNRCAMACQGCDAIFSTFSKKGSDRIVPR